MHPPQVAVECCPLTDIHKGPLNNTKGEFLGTQGVPRQFPAMLGSSRLCGPICRKHLRQWQDTSRSRNTNYPAILKPCLPPSSHPLALFQFAGPVVTGDCPSTPACLLASTNVYEIQIP